MPKFRDTIVALGLAAVFETIIINYAAPDLMLAKRFSRSILRLFLINTSLYLGYKILIFPFFISGLRKLPGPKGGNILWGYGPSEIVKKPPGSDFLKWVSTVPNDGLLRFRGFFNTERLLPTSVESLRSILGDHAYDYVKPTPIRSFLIRILGEGLILAEGDLHRFQRKHLLPAFQVKQIRDLYPVFWDKSRSLLERLEAEMTDLGTNGSIEFTEWSTRVTLDIIGVAGMGRDFNALRNSDDPLVQNYEELLDPTRENAAFFATNMVLGTPLTKLLPWKKNETLVRITRNLKQYCIDLVHTRQAEIKAGRATDKMDIITLLIKSNDFKDTELVDQMLTFLAAGHETTSSAITWVLYLLTQHPKMQAILREEIRTKLPSPSTLTPPSPADVEALPYLNAVCNETLRLYPTVPVTIREAIHDTTIPLKTASGPVEQKIPAGTRLLIAPWAINRSPLIWGENAGDFVPDRWLGEGNAQTGGQSSNYAQITFLHGARSCIGQGFAKAELKCLAAALVGRFEVEMADPGLEVYPAGVITTKPANGMRLRFKVIEGW